MCRAPIQDPLFGAVTIRSDGRAVHDLYLFEVKAPSESAGPYDYYKLLERFRVLRNQPNSGRDRGLSRVARCFGMDPSKSPSGKKLRCESRL
jgi:hypothetical protein